MENKTSIKARVLIVDDNPKNLQVLGSALRNQNYEIEFSTSGKGALKWLKEENFDLILLDIMMPEMDGFETCRIIRDELKLNIPIIFLTAKTEKESIIKGFQTGSQDYITKPFDAEELLARVRTHVELKLSRQKLENINQYLEEQVTLRTKELSFANKELSGLDDLKTEFLNMLSHEIRSPLNGIMGSLQLLKVRTENEELLNLINILDQSVYRLEQFSYTALLITRLIARKHDMLLSDIPILDNLDYILLSLNEKIKLKPGLEIDTTNLKNTDLILADKELYHEIMIRLLDNSIRFSPSESTIYLSVTETNNYSEISIKDEGPGFAAKVIDNQIKLFNPGEKHINKNMGLSLYLSNLIMGYHNGKMKIENPPEGGAKITLRFPKEE